MKRLLVLAGIVALAGYGCGRDSNPNNPSNTPTVFNIALRAANQPVLNP